MRRAAAAALIAGLAACAAPLASDGSPAVEIDALTWLADTADPVAELVLQPATCLTAPEDPSVQRGALLFASPMLLGGQAAKARLSCASCHRNGRDHPAFVFTGISGAPGTADVTHGLFSSIRADGTFNPVPIPDLAASAGRSRVDRDSEGVLEAFLRAQIVEEFSGATPEDAVIADLAAYIRALDARACSAAPSEPQSWRDELALLQAGLTRPETAEDAYINAMRAALGRLHDRYAGPEHATLRADLVRISRGLADGMDMNMLKADLKRMKADLAAAEAGSFYDPDVLRQALR